LEGRSFDRSKAGNSFGCRSAVKEWIVLNPKENKKKREKGCQFIANVKMQNLLRLCKFTMGGRSIVELSNEIWGSGRPSEFSAKRLEAY